MKLKTIFVIILAAITCAIIVPGAVLAQSVQPVGGTATVIGVDQPDNCLRIRSGPGNSYDIIDCANLGDQLNITGVWTTNDWAQLADSGWVYGPQIQTDLRPPREAFSSEPSYAVTEEVVPVYDDWSYLPNYGYNTYWYSGVPIFLYSAALWHKFHPWSWRHGHHAWWWRDGHHGKRAWDTNSFNNFVRTSNRQLTGNRNLTPGQRARLIRNLPTDPSSVSSINRPGRDRNLANRSNLSQIERNRLTNQNRANLSAAQRERLRNLNQSNINRANSQSNLRSINRDRTNKNFTNRSNTANLERLNKNLTNRSNITSPNRSGTNRNFANRSHVTTPNVNRLRSGSTNVSPRTLSRQNTLGTPNVSRSRNFSSPQTLRSGNIGTKQFRGVPRSGGVSSAPRMSQPSSTDEQSCS